MDRQAVESILFNLPRWEEMSSVDKIPALVVRNVSLSQAEEIYNGGQFVIGQSGLDAKPLFDFFRRIADGSRLYYLDGYLKHPNFHDQQPLFVGQDVHGLKLTEAEVAEFSALFGEVEKLENDDSFFFASWGSSGWSRLLYEA